MSSPVPLVKHYHVNLDEDDKKIKKGPANVLIFFKHVQLGMDNYYTLPFYIMECLLLNFNLKIFIQKISTFIDLPELKCNAYIKGF